MAGPGWGVQAPVNNNVTNVLIRSVLTCIPGLKLKVISMVPQAS